MILLTPELRERLLANGRHHGLNHVPVVKFFNPLGTGTWLATELDRDGDTLFGVAALAKVLERYPIARFTDRAAT